MLTPKAFTPPYGPAGEKVMWTIVETRVERNGVLVFGLDAITGAVLRPAANRLDFHQLHITAEGQSYAFSTMTGQTVDTDGWQWFVITLLRRAQTAAPGLRVDVSRMGAEPGTLLLGILAVALGLASAGLWLTAGTDEPEAAVVARALILLACLIGGSFLIIKGRPRSDIKSLVTPDAAADMVLPRVRRRYRS